MQSLKKIVINGLIFLGLSFGISVPASSSPLSNDEIREAMQIIDKENEKSAEQGNLEAQSNLATEYYNGWGRAKDYHKAFMWFQESANQGDASAQYALGLMYRKGQGVRQDYAKAIKWYEKAANQGNIEAQNNLGTMHYHGFGVSKSLTKAKKWYGIACDNGSQKGCDNYRILNQK
jgi:hypothetical protein